MDSGQIRAQKSPGGEAGRGGLFGENPVSGFVEPVARFGVLHDEETELPQNLLGAGVGVVESVCDFLEGSGWLAGGDFLLELRGDVIAYGGAAEFHGFLCGKLGSDCFKGGVCDGSTFEDLRNEGAGNFYGSGKVALVSVKKLSDNGFQS